MNKNNQVCYFSYCRNTRNEIMLAVSSSLEYAHFDNWKMAVRLAQLELVFSRSDNNHIGDFGVNNEKKKKKKKVVLQM